MKQTLIILALLMLPFSAMAEPVYTEGESYQVEVLEDGQIQVRKATRVYKDGVEISKTYHRHVIDVESPLLDEVPRVAAIAEVVWTDEVKAARKAFKDAEAMQKH